MLPITHHRTVHVAAIVALITALGWHSVDGGRSTADASEPVQEVTTTVRGTADDDADSGGGSARADRAGRGLSGLLPLVLPSVTAP
jgi:hypothetical protein